MSERFAAGGPIRPATGDQLPALTLTAIDGGGVNLRGGRGPRVVFTPHETGCAECARYLQTLAVAAGGAAEWGGTVMVVLPGSADGDLSALDRTAVRVLRDPERTFAPREPIVLVADEWGEVYFASDAAADHALPAADELVEWVRFIAIQCPECEGPEGPWRTL